MATEIYAGKDWLVDYDSNVGEVTLLTRPVQGVAGLRKPYQFELPAKSFDALFAKLRAVENQSKCQHFMVERKPTRYGSRLEVWSLAFKPGFVGDERGVTEEEWAKIYTTIVGILIDSIGNSIKPYCEAWNPDRKFQFRFETYVKFKEL